MRVIINGKEIELNNSKTIADLVVERKVVGSMFVIEKNLEIIDKENYAAEEIKEGDMIEIVGFVGGG